MNERVRARVVEREPQGQEQALLFQAAQLDVVKNELLHVDEAAYYLGWQNRINPEHKALNVLYSHMGPDIVTPLLATDATSIVGVDWLHWDRDDVAFVQGLSGCERFLPTDFVRNRKERGFYYSPTPEIRTRLLVHELASLGVQPESVYAEKMTDGIEIRFLYQGKERLIRYIAKSWHDFQDQAALSGESFSVFYEKAQLDQHTVMRPVDGERVVQRLAEDGYVMTGMGSLNASYDLAAWRRIRNARFVERVDALGCVPVAAPIRCNRLIQRMRLRKDAHLLYGTYLQVAQKKSV